MANELRVRQNCLGGKVEDNPLAIGATTLTSAALAAMVAISATQHLSITLDPDGIFGAPEIVWVTAHVAGATTATILRAQEGTTARSHKQDVDWSHGPTAMDDNGIAIAARGYLVANQAMTTATVTVITLTGESFDTHAMHDLVTNNSRITVPQTGKYLVVATVAHGATSGQVQTRIHKNGAFWSLCAAAGTAFGINLQCVDVMSLAAGDYVELAAYQASGSTFNAGGGEGQTSLAVTYMGV